MVDNIIGEMLKEKNYFYRKDIKEKLHENGISVNESTVTRNINKLIEKGYAKKIGKKYIATKEKIKNIYHYVPSEKTLNIKDLIINTYPNLEFEIWEIFQLNEFLNHLIGKNCFIIEVEKDYELIIFELLNEHYPRVLLNPSYDTFSLYSQDEPMVVKRLISRTPQNRIDCFQPCIEKLVIDLLHDPFTSKLINYNELKQMYKICDENYCLDKKILLSYAKRRNAQEKIEELINVATGSIL